MARGDEAGEMGHVDQQVGAHAVGDLAHFREVEDARNGRAARDQHLGLVFGGKGRDLVVIDLKILLAHAVLDRVEPLARLVGLGAVGQVAARVEAHAENRVARCEQRGEDALVGLRAGVGLDVREAHAEQRLGPLDRQFLGDVDILAAAVVAPTGVALGIFVGHHRALRLHHGGRDDVFRGDQLDLVALAAQLLADRAEDLGIAGLEAFGEETFVAVGGIHGSVSLGGGLHGVS